MGYYTYFTLEVEGGPAEQRCPTCGHIGEWRWEDLISQFLDGYDPFQESCKWYEWEEDMRKFSARYPEWTFILEGDGEESDDRWRAYFKNGKAYTDTMEFLFPEFDESKLT